MSERREGWYWVRHKQNRVWVVEEKKGDWFSSEDFHFSAIVDAFEIGPRIPKPDEPWQCVPVEVTYKMDEKAFVASGCPSDWYGFSDMWAAALAAAPKPEDY